MVYLFEKNNYYKANPNVVREQFLIIKINVLYTRSKSSSEIWPNGLNEMLSAKVVGGSIGGSLRLLCEVLILSKTLKTLRSSFLSVGPPNALREISKLRKFLNAASDDNKSSILFTLHNFNVTIFDPFVWIN